MADMTNYERVQAALAFKTPDRIPRFDNFWMEFSQKCRRALSLDQNVELDDYFGNDLCVAVADETPFSAQIIEQRGADTIIRDGWGCLVRQRKGSYFSEVLQIAINSPADLERSFRSSSDPGRYKRFGQTVMKQKEKGMAVFCKIGGPYMRSSFMRGKEEFLIDISSDPQFASAIAAKVTDHLLQIALESLRLRNLYDTGVWIYDDIAYNSATMISPKAFERIFLPLYIKLIHAIKAAGARHVIFHSDGNILQILDMLLDAGINGINPVEPRAGMLSWNLRRKYGDRLALIGGMCNSIVLPNGPVSAIEEQARAIIAAGKEGGVIIGAHSIGPDIPADHYLAYDRVVRKEGYYIQPQEVAGDG